MRRRAVHMSFAFVTATCGTLAIWCGLRLQQSEHISTESLARAMSDRRFARRTQAATDLYWIAALMALVLLAVRFAPFTSGGIRYGRRPNGGR
jgi:hypothetical protein